MEFPKEDGVKVDNSDYSIPPGFESLFKGEKVRSRSSSKSRAIENVIENESHFSLEVVDQDLSSLAMFTKHFMGEQRKRVVRSQWQKRRELRWVKEASIEEGVEVLVLVPKLAKEKRSSWEE
ncbi:hypothetical protein Tco_0217893 [Tanacetum coccineum]